MSRVMAVYTYKGDPDRVALAAEITAEDVQRGRGGAVGDYYVMEPNYRAQWTERASFLETWELLASPETMFPKAALQPALEDAAREIDNLAPAEPAAAIATRENFASSSSSAAASVDIDQIVARLLELHGTRLAADVAHIVLDQLEREPGGLLEKLRADVDDVSRGVVIVTKTAGDMVDDVRDRLKVLEEFQQSADEIRFRAVELLEMRRRIETLEDQLAKFEKALGVDPAELEQLETGKTAAADASSNSSAPAPADKKKKGGAK